MAPIRRVVLDVLKPHEPTILELAQTLSDSCEGVAGVNAVLLSMDQEVENVKLTIEGDDIDYPSVKGVIANLGGSIHSIDQTVCGDIIVEEQQTPQDRYD